MNPNVGGLSLWAALVASIFLVVLIGFLFAHLFLLIALASLVIGGGIWIAEKLLGPGTKISLRVPPEMTQKMIRWLLGSRRR
jgi:hypothetical protein